MTGVPTGMRRDGQSHADRGEDRSIPRTTSHCSAAQLLGSGKI